MKNCGFEPQFGHRELHLAQPVAYLLLTITRPPLHGRRRPLCMPTPARVAPRGDDIGNCVDDFGYRYKSWPMPLARQVHPSLDASPFGE